jgi:peroxiredoxin
MAHVLLKYLAKLLRIKSMPALSAGATAPNFQLTTTTGERLSLQEALAGGPILLAFFKVSCPTCQFTFPYLERLYRQLREPGVRIWGIVQDKSADGVQFAQTMGITFPILIDDSPYEVSRAYGLTHVPSLFLTEPDGRIELSSEGFSRADLQAIQNSLAQKLSAAPPALFLPNERIPEFKPG